LKMMNLFERTNQNLLKINIFVKFINKEKRIIVVVILLGWLVCQY